MALRREWPDSNARGLGVIGPTGLIWPMSLVMKTSPLQRGPDLLTENLPKGVNVCPKSPIFTSNYSMNDSPAEIGNSDPKPRGEEARRRRRERRNKEFRGLKLYPV